MSLVDLGKRLLEAAKQGLTDEVRTLMSNGAPFTTDWLGTSPLHYAAQQGHVGTAEVLLRAGISRDARTKVDRTPLHVASQEGHQDVVDLLIKSGADIEAKDMLKMTPLHWAVEKGHVGVIELLLGHGADINIDNKFDRNPVEIAINNGRADLAELLQLSRLPQQNVVEVTTDPTVVEEVTTNVETTHEVLLDEGAEAVSTGAPNVLTSSTVASGADGEGTEQSSTAVLATLAALAEASGPLNASNATNTTAAEALNWLESHGITMISGDNPTTMVDSGGQSLSLTEAGKLALDFVKQKVIAVAADQNELTDENGTPMVIRLTSSGEAVAEAVTDQDEPLLKKIKLEESGTDAGEYVLTKTEPEDAFTEGIPEDSILEHGTAIQGDEIEHITTETISEEGVSIEGGMMITEDGVIVTQEGMVVHQGLDGITVQSEVIEGDQEIQTDDVNDVITTEEIQGFEVQHEVDEEVLHQDQEIQQETIESTEEEEQLVIRDRLDEITSKT